jgi:hypothetical protein
MPRWSVWFRHLSERSGLWIEIQTARPMRVRDIETIEKLCGIWKEVAAEEEAASLPTSGPCDPADSKTCRARHGNCETSPRGWILCSRCGRPCSVLDLERKAIGESDGA